MPSRITIRVGIEEIPSAPASSGWASVSTLPNTASAWVPDARSNTGPNMRHGPHHAAQKSTSTSPSPLVTASKFADVSSTVAMESSSPRQRGTLIPLGVSTAAHKPAFPLAPWPETRLGGESAGWWCPEPRSPRRWFPAGRLLGPTGGLLIGLSPGRWVAGSVVAGYALARGLAAAGQ